MHNYKGRFEPTRFEDLTVTVDFHCNSACRFCIAQEGMNYFKGLPLDTFRKAVEDNTRAPRYRRVTFTGGEVTLERSLFHYVEVARGSGSFDHIRLQTNGRLMADAAFARRLVDAGIDEYFVSLHGPNAEVQDHISQRPGSFDEAVQGIENLRALGVTLMTNTVITTLNVDHLSDIVDCVAAFEPTLSEFWNYLPMEDYADERGLLVPMPRLAPALVRAFDRADDIGLRVAAKYVPQCLLGPHGAKLDNAQPDVVVVEAFYDIYPKHDCLYEAKCEHSDTCLGLTHPYIEKFGWEHDVLVPVARTTPWKEPEYGVALGTHVPDGSASPALAHPAWHALVDGVADQTGAGLRELLLSRRSCIYRFAVGDDSSVDVVVEARHDDAPYLAQSRSFNISYRAVTGPAAAALKAVVRSAVRAIVARDDGSLHLDRRKGLVGDDAVRRR